MTQVIALYDEVRILGLPGPYRNIEYVQGDKNMVVEHLITKEVKEVLAEYVVLFAPDLGKTKVNNFPVAGEHSIPVGVGIYDNVMMMDMNIATPFIICDTYEATGILEVEDEGEGKVFFVNPDQIKVVW